jgi:hypothetical protein
MNPDRVPAVLLAELAKEVTELSEASEGFGRARRTLARCQYVYEQAMAEKLIALRDETRESGERLPGEEMRRAICHSQMSDDERSNLLMSEAEVDALEKFIRVKTAVVSALQSELSFLRTEFAQA